MNFFASVTQTTSEQPEHTGAKDKWEQSALMEQLQNNISFYFKAQWGKTADCSMSKQEMYTIVQC